MVGGQLKLDSIMEKMRLHLLMCQSGTITEDLLPRSFLIRMSSQTHYGYSLPLDWYYGNLLVEQYFEQDENIFCKIRIPLVRSESFLSKKIFTYPVKRNNTVMRVFHDTWVAVGTTSGRLFYPPDDCMGKNPTVCHAGMVFNTNQELCVRGIISGNEIHKKLCSVHVSTLEQGHSLVKTGRNAYVVYTKDGVLTRRCPKQAPLSTPITEGLYILELTDNCVAETEEWRLEGVRYLTRQLGSDNQSILEFPTFPHIDVEFSNKIETYLNVTKLQKYTANEAIVLDLPATIVPQKIHVWESDHTMIVIYVIAAITSVLILSVACYCCFCGPPQCCTKNPGPPTEVHFDAAREKLTVGQVPASPTHDLSHTT